MLRRKLRKPPGAIFGVISGVIAGNLAITVKFALPGFRRKH